MGSTRRGHVVWDAGHRPTIGCGTAARVAGPPAGCEQGVEHEKKSQELLCRLTETQQHLISLYRRSSWDHRLLRAPPPVHGLGPSSFPPPC